jgi:hypothetical protein
MSPQGGQLYRLHHKGKNMIDQFIQITSPFGTKLIKSLLAAPFSATTIEMVVPNTDTTSIFINDVVKTIENSDPSGEDFGIEYCSKATSADPIRGIVVDFKVIHEYENSTYRLASTRRIVRICQDPFLICQARVNAVVSPTDVNMFINIDSGTGNTSTGISSIQLDYATINDNGGQFRITKILDAVNTSENKYTIVECVIQRHEFLEGSVSSGDLWQRIGTTLYTTNAGDNVHIEGKLTVDGLIDPTALVLTPQNSAPISSDGTIYYDSITNSFQFRQNGTWQNATSGSNDVFPGNSLFVRKFGNDIAETHYLDSTPITGFIYAASDFPATLVNGACYMVPTGTTVTDNDITKTNTGQTFVGPVQIAANTSKNRWIERDGLSEETSVCSVGAAVYLSNQYGSYPDLYPVIVLDNSTYTVGDGTGFNCDIFAPFAKFILQGSVTQYSKYVLFDTLEANTNMSSGSYIIGGSPTGKCSISGRYVYNGVIPPSGGIFVNAGVDLDLNIGILDGGLSTRQTLSAQGAKIYANIGKFVGLATVTASGGSITINTLDRSELTINDTLGQILVTANTNDIGSLNGTLTSGKIPVATGIHNLADSKITQDLTQDSATTTAVKIESPSDPNKWLQVLVKAFTNTTRLLTNLPNLEIWTNSVKAATFNSSGDLTVIGNVTATNLSGTNTGDQTSGTVPNTSPVAGSTVSDALTTLNNQIGISAGAAVAFYLDDTNIIPTGTQNANEVNTLTKTPVTTTEVLDSIVVNNNTVLKEVYLYDTALSGSQIEAGQWQFDLWREVDVTAGISQILINTRQVIKETGTITITGTGTSRTATSSALSVFVSGDANVDVTVASYIQTPTGFFQITGFTSGQVVTISTLSTYVNESAVAYSKHKKLFQVATGDINDTSLALQSIISVQPAFPISSGDKLSLIYFGTTTRTSNTTISYTHNGSSRYSHVTTPLAVRHDDLAGLASASPSEPYGHIPFDNLPNGVGCVLQPLNDNSISVANTAYADRSSLAAAATVNTSLSQIIGQLPSGGNQFYLTSTVVKGQTDNNNIPIYNLTNDSPNVTEQSITMVAHNTGPTLSGAYLFNNDMSFMAGFRAGISAMKIWASVADPTPITQLTMNGMCVHAYTGQTVTITGTGTSRTATTSGNTFVGGDGTSSLLYCSYLMTPLGLFPITAISTAQIATITVPSTYTNESAVSFSKMFKLYQLNSLDIGSTTVKEITTFTTPQLELNPSNQWAWGDKFCILLFGQTTMSSSVITFKYAGPTNYSYIETPRMNIVRTSWEPKYAQTDFFIPDTTIAASGGVGDFGFYIPYDCRMIVGADVLFWIPSGGGLAQDIDTSTHYTAAPCDGKGINQYNSSNTSSTYDITVANTWYRLSYLSLIPNAGAGSAGAVRVTNNMTIAMRVGKIPLYYISY